ncbi:MAG: type VI secretion system membrane subunit TssM [Marinibacterium sp.]
MKAVMRAVFSGIGITLMLSLILSLCLWFLGGFLGFGDARPFESVAGRVIGIGVIWVVALILILVLLLRASRRDKELAEDIVSSAEPLRSDDDDDSVVTEELGEMRAKLREAMLKLRKSKLGKRSLYELPWYILIGPPGAGKTTAIVNSGLQFPLADEVGKASIGGVGGTRNCDWWFTDNAVLVDTAGRYTTQESDSVADNAAWLGFLGILKKHRKRQPINGAIVAISLSDLSMQDELTQKAHAGAIRRRLHELREKLGVRFPVYVLFTKADLLAGFSEFFEPLGKEDRAQVWGFTLPLLKGRSETSPLAHFDEEYSALVTRLNQQSVERIQSETDPSRRSLVAGFPGQVASVQPVARAFLTELFQDNRYEDRHLLRGVYFTSGTQEGTPIDRLMTGMARTFGIGRQAIGSGQGTGRSYFLTRLFDNVIFRESGLVSADDKVERRFRWSRRGAIAATIIVAIGAGTLWISSFRNNRAMAAEVEQQLLAFKDAAAQVPGSPIRDSDLPSVVPALNILRDIPVNPAHGKAEVARNLTWGLYQGEVIGNQTALTYRAALNRMLLPRLLLRLEEQMQGNINNPDLLYEALKVYLMLGLAGPMNADLVTEWMHADWSLAYPGTTRGQLRSDLASHLQAMISQPMDAIDLNADLVEQVRGVLTSMSQAQRVYNGIVNSPAATALPQWRLTDIGGPNLSRAIVRSSGENLNAGIEGIYTYAGFHDVFLSEALGVATRIQRDSWVLGDRGAIDNSQAALVTLSRDVLDLYYNDFVAKYDRLLGDIDIIPMQSLSHAVEVTNVLSGPTSPIVNILTAVARETDLLAVPEDQQAVDDASGVAGAVGGTLARRKLSPTSRLLLEAMEASGAGGDAPPPPGSYVTDRFAWLHEMVARKDGQPSQLDSLISALTEVYQELNQLNIGGGFGTTQGNSTALARFQQVAAQMDGPIERWSKQIAQGSSGIAAGNTRAGIDGLWQANVRSFCEQATANAYPFNRQSKADIAMSDFIRLFGPGGRIDSFFTENLAKYVDFRTRPWSWKKVNGADLGISDAVLRQMQNAAEIREAFFGDGGAPSVQFQITPEALDPSANGVVLDIDGTRISFLQGQGQPRPTAITWPGQVGAASITYVPPRQGSRNALSRDGPWAWFRLLDSAELRKTNVSDRKRVIFNVGGRIAIFGMQSGSVLNPFALPALANFKCPQSF